MIYCYRGNYDGDQQEFVKGIQSESHLTGILQLCDASLKLSISLSISVMFIMVYIYNGVMMSMMFHCI